MSLLENIRKDMLDASKQGDDITVDILKLVIADIRNEQIALDKELTDEDVLKVLRKQEKKIKDSIEQYTKMERDDLVSRESAQLKVIEKYLPSLMSEDEITKIVSRVIADTNASGIQSMGLVMGSVMKELNGKADGNLVKDVVGKLLQSKMQLEIFNTDVLKKTFPEFKLSLENIQKGYVEVFQKYNLGDINIVFVDNKYIQKLNKEYRGVDTPTDVLSFKLDENRNDGEIYISGEYVYKSFKGEKFTEEILRLIIHGTLHILGYDHIDSLNENPNEEMFKLQEKLLFKYIEICF